MNHCLIWNIFFTGNRAMQAPGPSDRYLRIERNELFEVFYRNKLFSSSLIKWNEKLIDDIKCKFSVNVNSELKKSLKTSVKLFTSTVFKKCRKNRNVSNIKLTLYVAHIFLGTSNFTLSCKPQRDNKPFKISYYIV